MADDERALRERAEDFRLGAVSATMQMERQIAGLRDELKRERERSDRLQDEKIELLIEMDKAVDDALEMLDERELGRLVREVIPRLGSGGTLTYMAGCWFVGVGERLGSGYDTPEEALYAADAEGRKGTK